MLLVALIIACSGVHHLPVYQLFGRDYDQAVHQLETDHAIIQHECGTYLVNENLVEAMVFPEYIRNNALRGLLEEKVLEAGYVQYGSDQVDFSIGKFQMKPSFAKKIEDLILANTPLARKYRVLLNNKDSRSQRQVRVERLKSLKWQTRYACFYIEYCTQEFNLEDKDEPTRLKYLSTLYNTGFLPANTPMNEYFEHCWFPYGPSVKVNQVAYWEVALDYYIKYKPLMAIKRNEE